MHALAADIDEGFNEAMEAVSERPLTLTRKKRLQF